MTTSTLRVHVEGLWGLDAVHFVEVAREAERRCPVSSALRGGLRIDVDAEAR